MRRILRIDLDKKSWQSDAIESGPYSGLGGRGLTSRIVSNEVPPMCDPLGRENKMVFAGGILAGSTVPNSGRLSIGAKSPLTKTIKEANSGGTAAQKLAKLGIQAVVVEGISKDPTCLKIHSSGVDFLPPAELKMAGNYKLIEMLRGKHGEEIGIISIGPAGERMLQAAAVAVTTPDFHIRTASRGGLGAVMGSKNIKAIIIDDKGSVGFEAKNKELLKVAVKSLSKGISSHPIVGGLQIFGTPLLVNMINELGGLPTGNYSRGRFDGAEKISGEYLGELMKKRPNANSVHRCMPGCIINCSNVFTDEKGKFVVSGLEYETIAMLGSNCMIDDIDSIARLNHICNDIGVDTMDIGAAIAVAMESGLLEWGDGPAAEEFAKEIGMNTERGRMLGNGCRFTGEALGAARIPDVKGQSLAGYDPRILKGTGVTYATSTMGADHTCGNALPSPANPGYNPSSAKGQQEISKFLQTYFAAIDTLGLCLFAAIPALDMPELQQYIIDCASAVLGTPLDSGYLMALGDAVLKTERGFNVAAGFDRSHDRLPQFFMEERIEPSGNVFDVSDEDLDMVYGH